ncbi:MAG: stage II sporulation protein D, partial [Clostridia bacterium]|nr:stage II sporulation protein D [Clostridia bacterium]
MKKIFLMYITSVILIIFASYLMTLKNDKNDKFTQNLPEKINVYFKDENVTREIDFEDYIKCVVSAEVPAAFDEEAIKAQAVAARTYIYNKYKKFTQDPSLAPEEHKDAVVCTDSTHCCAYYSIETLTKIHGEEWMKKYYDKICNSVEDTKGEVIVYEDEPILAVFHSSSGGCRTENSGDVWSSNLPYLVSVESPDEDKREGYNSVVKVKCDDFKDKINNEFPEAFLSDDRNTWFGDISYTAGNSVNVIKIGNAQIKGTDIRRTFGLKSACFEVDMLNDTIIFNVHGSGHGV